MLEYFLFSRLYRNKTTTSIEIYIRNSNRFISNNESKLPNPLITVERTKANSTEAPFDHPSPIETRLFMATDQLLAWKLNSRNLIKKKLFYLLWCVGVICYCRYGARGGSAGCTGTVLNAHQPNIDTTFQRTIVPQRHLFVRRIDSSTEGLSPWSFIF